MQPIAQVFQEALHEADEERRWELVAHLHHHGGQQALETASALRHHAEPSHRTLAADVLSQLGAAPGGSAMDGPFHDAALTVLLTMIEDEHDPAVLQAIALAFSHIGDERCVEPLARLHRHPDDRVREGVVFGLLQRQEPATPACTRTSRLSWRAGAKTCRTRNRRTACGRLSSSTP